MNRDKSVTVERIVARALEDVAFRSEVISGDDDRVRKALEGEFGWSPTPEQIHRIHAGAWAMEEASQRIDETGPLAG